MSNNTYVVDEVEYDVVLCPKCRERHHFEIRGEEGYRKGYCLNCNSEVYIPGLLDENVRIREKKGEL